MTDEQVTQMWLDGQHDELQEDSQANQRRGNLRTPAPARRPTDSSSSISTHSWGRPPKGAVADPHDSPAGLRDPGNGSIRE